MSSHHTGTDEIGTPGTLLSDLADAARSAPDPTEIVCVRQRLGLTRFARGRIHQNVEDVATRIWVRSWRNGGMGWAASGDASPQGVRTALELAGELASRTSAVAPELSPSADYPEVTTFFDATAHFDPVRRAEVVGGLLEHAGPVDLTGNVRTGTQDLTVVNSAGLSAFAPLTYAALGSIARSDTGSTGYAGLIGRDVDSLDFASAVEEAVATAAAGRHPLPVPEGDYRVVLDPPAVSMILLSLGYVGLNSFGGVAAAEGTSFVHLNLGKQVAAPVFSLVDDPLDTKALPMPFDTEGTPRRRLPIIDKGIAVATAHDRASGSAAGNDSTGHALPAGGKGPAPISLAVEAGSVDREEMLEDLGRGLLIKRIHPFVSLTGGKEAELSGTTRDGVFFVEEGEIVGAAHNVRWSNRMTDAFRSVEGVSAQRSVEFMDLPEIFPSTTHVPSLLCGTFTVHGSQPRE